MTHRFDSAVQIAIGNELLSGHTIDSNAALIARALWRNGIAVRERVTVSDRFEDILEALCRAVTRAPLVITSGGLGATPDDRTRAVLAELSGTELVETPAVLDRLEALAARRGRPVSDTWRRQAWLPAGAALLDNPAGLAPGIWLDLATASVCALPGVPREVEAILAGSFQERVRAATSTNIVIRTLRTTGLAESDADRLLAGLPLTGTELAFLPGRDGLDLRLRASGDGAVERVAAAVDAVRATITDAAGDVVYGEDDETLAGIVLEQLAARGMQLCLAESCTGGWIAKRLTDIPGSSRVLDRGLVCYSNDAKIELLGVPAELLAEHGAVSAPVAVAMARGARALAAPERALGAAVTGIAGPAGGTETKPVGTVHIAIDGPSGVHEERLWLPGGRVDVRRRTVAAVLDRVRRYADLRA